MLLSAAYGRGRAWAREWSCRSLGAAPKALGRREVLQGLMGVAGAGLALPAVAQDHPVRDHLAHAERVATADKRASVPGAKPVFLDAHQMETLTSPRGAHRARLHAGAGGSLRRPAPRRGHAARTSRKFLSALGWIDGEATARFQHPWKALTAAQQTELLTAVSTAEVGRAAALLGARRGGDRARRRFPSGRPPRATASTS